MATIRDVAAKAKVSVGTVSNVLRGSSSVSEQIRNRVASVIQILDYHPNQSARSLKTSQSHLIGMVISDITNPFFPQLARGAEDAAIQHGYLLISSNTDDQLDREKQALSVLRSRRVDGILLVVAPNGGDTEHLQKLVASDIPVVCLDRVPEGLSLDAVTTDAVQGAEMCLRHLLAVGHRSIAIIVGNLQLQTARDRLRGYENALAEQRIPVDPSLVFEGDFRMESGYLLTKRMLLGKRKPTAVFVCNGMMALGAFRAIKELGLRCPEDIAVAVFDEVPGNGSFTPEITCVVQPAYQIGYQGVKLLLSRMDSGGGHAAKQTVLPAELRIAESSRPTRGSSVD